MTEKRLLPHIRFSGFSDNWEKEKIVSIIEIYSGLTYKPEDIQKFGTLVLRSSNVKDGKIINCNNVYVSPSVVNSKNVQKNDIVLVVRNGSKNLIGKHALINADMKNTVIGAFMSGLRSKNGLFVNALLDTVTFKREVFKSLGATINQITNKDLRSMAFLIPKTCEQQKVGDLFAKLDRLLDLQQQKLDQLELLKKVLLQKLFPKKDAKIPELRFKGFAQEWKKERLGKITEIVMGQSPSSKNYLSSKIRESYVLIQGNADIKDNEVVPRVWTTQVTRLSNPGDIILTVRAPVGELARNKFQAVIGRGVSAFKGNDFLFYYLQKLNMEGYWQHFAAGSTFESVSSKDIAFTVTKLTSVAEQQKIGNLLAKVDRLIELENKKFSNLKLVKKILLQNMFVE